MSTERGSHFAGEEFIINRKIAPMSTERGSHFVAKKKRLALCLSLENQ